MSQEKLDKILKEEAGKVHAISISRITREEKKPNESPRDEK